MSVDKTLIEDQISSIRKEMIQKRNLLDVSNEKIILDSTSISTSTSTLSPLDEQKIRILSLIKQLKTIPYIPTTNSTISKSLADVELREQISQFLDPLDNDSMDKELFYHNELSKLYKLLKSELEKNLTKEAKLNSIDGNNSDASKDNEVIYQNLINKILELKQRSRKLVQYVKILVYDYIFELEFQNYNNDYEKLKLKRSKFLKLLETLLNNAMTIHDNGDNNKPKFIKISNKNDPLIRFLLLNRIIVIDKKNPNRIKLRDLTVNY